MSIVQIIPTTGKWYVMHRCEDSPETCQAVRIAAWARVNLDDAEVEVLPLIPDTEPGHMHKLVIPDAEQIVGICDEEGTRDPNWNDIAKHGADVEAEHEAREAATPEAALKVIDKLAEKGIGRDYVKATLLALRDRDTFEFNHGILHTFYECDVIEPAMGGYSITPLGFKALGMLQTNER